MPTLTSVARRSTSAVCVVVALTAGACSIDVGVTARQSEPSPTPADTTAPVATTPDTTPDTTPGTTPGTTPDTTPDTTPADVAVPLVGPAVELADVANVDPARPDREHDAFVAAVLADLDAWLGEVHPAVYGTPFTPLAGGVYPAHPGRDDVPGCGVTSTRYRDVSEYGAFYCALGDFIVYDDGDGDDSLLAELVDQYGPVALGVVLAHEHGHAVQSRAGDLDRGLPTIILEQHADCFAGAWVARAAQQRSSFLRLTDADVRGALITMVAVRDPVGIDQFAPGSHGSAFDRIGAFQEGFRHGPRRCADLIDEPLPLMPNQFQSFTDRNNDGDLPFGYGDGEIVPLVVDALNTYWSFEIGRAGIGFPALRVVPTTASRNDPDCSDRPDEVVTGLVVCLGDRLVILDDGVARDLYDDPIDGRADFAVGYFVALAWSEVVQVLLGSALTGTDRALTNDCLVGAWARDLDPRRPPRAAESDTRPTISPGDLDEAVLAAIETADDGFATGSAFDKVDAFRSGVLGGMTACTDRIPR